MPWARLDDAFYTHRKVIDVSPSARWLFVAGLCYCNQNLTDGEISTSAALSIGMIPSPKRAIGELVKAGLWIRHEGGGYQVHDYLKYQLSREQILKQRDAAARRQERLRRGRNGQYGDEDEPPDDGVTEPVSHGVTDGVTSPEVTTAPYPHPPSVSDSHHQTTSSCGEPDKPDDETPSNRTNPDRLATAEAACDLLGDQAHADAVARGVVLRPGPHLKACRQSARTDHLADAQLLVYRDPELTPETIAAQLTEPAPVNGWHDPNEPQPGALIATADRLRRERAAEGPQEADKATNLTGLEAARAALVPSEPTE